MNGTIITVGIIGTRGIPNRYGGFERFVELLVEEPSWPVHRVRFVVYGEGETKPYNGWTRLQRVGIEKNQRPLGYYIASCIQATRECDVIVCCGVGLSYFSLWPVLRGRTLVVNPDGCEWRRTKWSALGRLAIRAMYWPALAAARHIVIDSEALRADFGAALGKKARYIGYQAPAPRLTPLTEETRQRMSIARPFALVIARLEPENNIEMTVQAFNSAKDGSAELIVVGGTTTPYFTSVLAPLAGPDVRFVGAIYDQSVLEQLRSTCVSYVHGHSVGGTNPSLLEALATVGGQICCHDNKYNREVAGTEASYFANKQQLAELFKPSLRTHTAGASRTPTRDERFRPDTIAARFLSLFEDIRAAR